MEDDLFGEMIGNNGIDYKLFRIIRRFIKVSVQYGESSQFEGSIYFRVFSFNKFNLLISILPQYAWFFFADF